MAASEMGARRGIGVTPILATAAVVYWTLLGGTEAGVIVSAIRIANAAIAGLVIVWWVRRLPRANDQTDRLALIALLGFLAAGLLGGYPRFALDACSAAVAWTAAFYLARRLAATQRNVGFTLDLLGAAGIVVSLLFALLWGATWLRWAGLTGFRIWPPLTMDLPELVFHHVSAIAFTVLMLLPAVLRLWRLTRLRPVVLLAVLSTGFVVIASGSRTAWFAAALATALTLGVHLGRQSSLPRLTRRQAFTGLIGIAGLLAAALASGAGGPILERLGTFGTIVSRSQTWSAALHLWTQDPLSGIGPGSFVAALPTSGYFQLNSFAPHHADNAVIQLLAEGGIVAAMPLAVAFLVVSRRVLRESQSWSSVWAIGFFAFSSLTNNPTQIAGLNLLLVVWLAVALPAGAEHNPPRRLSPFVARAGAISLALIGLTYATTSIGQVAYDVALGEARSGGIEASRTGLAIAAALDPGVALYQRQLGLVALSQGDGRTAIALLSRAIEELPTDVISMRALAIAELRDGRLERALEVARRAATLRPSLTASLLLAATLEDRAGHRMAASSYLVAAITIDPLLPAARNWGTALPIERSTRDLVAEATQSAENGPAGNLPLVWFHQYLLASMADIPMSTGTISAVPDAWGLLLQCRLDEAEAKIIAAQATEGGSGDYWTVRAVIASATGTDLMSLRLASLASVEVKRLLTASPGGMSPAFDPAHDRAMYGRDALAELPGFDLFPTHAEGLSVWLREPLVAADRAAPASRLAECR